MLAQMIFSERNSSSDSGGPQGRGFQSWGATAKKDLPHAFANQTWHANGSYRRLLLSDFSWKEKWGFYCQCCIKALVWWSFMYKAKLFGWSFLFFLTWQFWKYSCWSFSWQEQWLLGSLYGWFPCSLRLVYCTLKITCFKKALINSYLSFSAFLELQEQPWRIWATIQWLAKQNGLNSS